MFIFGKGNALLCHQESPPSKLHKNKHCLLIFSPFERFWVDLECFRIRLFSA